MSSSITFLQIANAVAQTIGTIPSKPRIQPTELITESIQDLPLVQVYCERGTSDTRSQTDRSSMNAGVRVAGVTVYVDIYAKTRSNIGQDLKIAFEILNEIYDVLEMQNTKPFFGLPGIQDFSWTWERTTFEYANANFAGIRVIIEMRIY